MLAHGSPTDILIWLFGIGVLLFIPIYIWMLIKDGRTRRRFLTFPPPFAEKIARLPQSIGENRVRLNLSDGRRISNVLIRGDYYIAKVGQVEVKKPSDLDFKMEDIIDVLADDLDAS